MSQNIMTDETACLFFRNVTQAVALIPDTGLVNCVNGKSKRPNDSTEMFESVGND
jgi:hypothetical protein